MNKKLITLSLFVLLVLVPHSAGANLLFEEQDDYRIDVIHNTDMVIVYGFTPGDSLIFNFFETDTSEEAFYTQTMPTFEGPNYHLFGFQHGKDLVPGNVVKVSDGVKHKELEILDLEITTPVYGSPVISGEGPAGMLVRVDVYDDENIRLNQSMIIPASGQWDMDFSQIEDGFELSENMYIEAHIEEALGQTDGGGDRTGYVFLAVNPGMEAYYSLDNVSVYHCSPNAYAQLKVSDGTNLLFDPIAAVTDSNGNASFELWRYGYGLGYDVYLEIEDISTGFINSMKVDKFTGYEDFSDPNNKRLYGELPPLWPRNFAIEMGEVGLPVYHVSVEPNPDGTWEYYLGDKEIEGWSAFLYDGNGNATMVSKEGDIPPNPYIYVDIHGNRIIPITFGREADVRISVYQSESDEIPLDFWDVTLNSDGSYTLDTDEVIPQIDLGPGMVVNIKDEEYGLIERELILDLISITDFNPDTNTINGLMSADRSGTSFNLRVYLVGGGYHDVTVDINDGGYWNYAFDPLWEIGTISIWERDFVGDDVTAFVLDGISFIREVDKTGSSITIQDDQGDSITLTIPEDAVDAAISLSYTPQEAPTPPDGYSFAGSSFDLTASQSGEPIEDYIFQVPITVSLEYSDDDIIHQDENSLTLNYWDDNTQSWLDAAMTCDPSSIYGRYMDENYLEVEICHLSKFSLFGETMYTIYMPMIIEKQ